MVFLAWYHVFIADTCHTIVPGDSVAHTVARQLAEDDEYSDFESFVRQIDTAFTLKGYPFYRLSLTDSDTCKILYIQSGEPMSGVVAWSRNPDKSAQTELIQLERLYHLMGDILIHNQNSGYPFSKIEPKIYAYRGKVPVLYLDIDEGPLIVVDSMVVKSENPPRLFLIQKFSDLKLPFTYNLKKLNESVRRLENSGLVESTAPASVLFSHQGSTLYLYMNTRQRVFADVIVGLNTDNTNRTILTGEINLALKNIFRYAESIDLQWRAPGVEQQLLNLKFEFPFMFRSSLGWSGDVRLFRQDSTFATFSGQVSATYFFSPLVLAGIGAQRENSSVPGIFQPGVAAYSADYSFFKLHYKGISNHGLQRRGVSGSAEFAVGLLRRGENDYNRFRIQLHAESDFKIHSNHKLYNRFTLLHLDGPEILLNESFRTGGMGSIRGFNEWLFFTSSALLGVVEYRYFVDGSTYLKGFYDAAWQRIPFGQAGFFQGFGSGLAIPVGTGLFHIDVALGKFPNLPVNVRDTRLHISYNANF